MIHFSVMKLGFFFCTYLSCVWPCPPVSGRVWPCPALSRHVRPCPAVSGRVLPCPAVSGRVRPCLAVCGRVSLCVAVSRRVRSCLAVSGRARPCPAVSARVWPVQPAAAGRSWLQIFISISEAHDDVGFFIEKKNSQNCILLRPMMIRCISCIFGVRGTFSKRLTRERPRQQCNSSSYIRLWWTCRDLQIVLRRNLNGPKWFDEKKPKWRVIIVCCSVSGIVAIHMSKYFKVVGAVLLSRDDKGALDLEHHLRSLEICHSDFDNDVWFLLGAILLTSSKRSELHWNRIGPIRSTSFLRSWSLC